ncbi:MAG: hypothetical protein FWF59_07900 [Turicibacter sp.]|nr:hypothetical protein [Turicibacter sp.]
MKKFLALTLLLFMGACSENHEYDTDLTAVYSNTPLISIEKDALYHGERRVEITNNSPVPISYIASEIGFDVDYTEQSLDVWSKKNLAPTQNAIEDHILARQGQVINPNESLVLIIDMNNHPFDVNFTLNFNVDGEVIPKEITLMQETE